MVAILQVIDDGRIDNAIVTHFDRETIFLYPEVDNAIVGHLDRALDERELSDDSMPSSACSDILPCVDAQYFAGDTTGSIR
jgi:hypothetical protein